MQRHFAVVFCLLVSFMSGTVNAQSGFFHNWEDRVRATSKAQPSWAVPAFAPTSGLVQLARFDAYRQITPTHTITWNIDGGKGFNLIPWYKTEVDINMPPLIEHNNPKVADGAGDLSFLLKYRFAAAAETKGAYSISAGIAATAPTGSYKNGSHAGTVSPTIYLGKGFKAFDVQTAGSISLPTGYTAAMGRPVAWNTAFQYKIAKYFWPEAEVNATFFRGGTNDGKKQAFLTPGLMISKIKLRSSPSDRLAVVFGAGDQIAATHFHSYNHAVVITSRVVF
jgi:hypothetical protein